jgi:hypothetical protein
LAPGVAVPKFVDVLIGNRHAPCKLTQLPAGALSATSDPKLL